MESHRPEHAYTDTLAVYAAYLRVCEECELVFRQKDWLEAGDGAEEKCGLGHITPEAVKKQFKGPN